MNPLKANLLSYLPLLAMTGLSLYLYNDLPDYLPTDFNSQGEIERLDPKQFVALLLPACYLGVIIATTVLIAVSPQKFSMPNSKQAMHIIIFGVGVLLLFIHYSMLLAGGDMAFFTKYFSYGMALFLVITGNVVGKTERNFFLGIRTPWTIASPANWRVTHRLAGRMMVGVGLVLLLSTMVYSNLAITVVLCVSTLLIPAIYSFIFYLNTEKETESGQ